MATNGGQAIDAPNALPKETEDHSLLSKPINVGISGIQHVVHCLQRGTPEIRDMLLNECSLIYECKVCMSLHRSLVNFLAHKRTYCKQHLCETMMLFHAEDIEKETVIVQPEDPDSDISPAKDCLLSEIEHLEYNDQLEVGHQAPNILQPLHNSTKKVASTARIPQPPMPLCSTEVLDSVEHLIKRRVVPSVKESAEELALELERIPSNPNAMFQRRLGERKHEPEVNGDTNLSDEVLEADENSGSNQGYDSENNVHVDKLRGRTDCDIDSKTCLVCNTRYVSLKTLSFHMRNIHATVRTFYQCPYCEASFSQSWGVTRHLMQVHKRSRTQVTTIKPEVRRKTINKVEDIVKDRQPFHDEKRSQSPSATKTLKGGSVVKMEKANVGAFPCRKCGKSFNMKSAMAGHTSHCLRKKTKKVGATSNSCKVSKVSTAAEDKLAVLSTPTPSPPTPRTPPPPPVLSSVATRPKRLVKKKDTGDFVSGGRRVNVAQKKIERLDAPVAQPKNAIKEVYAQHLQQIESIISVPKLKCLKCVRKFSSISNLRRHTAIHLGWNRYKCCHCEYQSYTRSDCRSHIKRVHTEIKSSPNELDKMVIDLFVPQPRPRPGSKRSTKAGSSSASASPEPKSGSRVKRSPSLTSSPKTAKTKASPKVVPGSRSSRKAVVEKKPNVPLRPSTDSMLTLVTRASSYVKPNMALHLLRREKEKVAVRKKTKSLPNLSSGSREIKVNKGKTKVGKVKNEDGDGDVEEVECKAKDNVVMEDLVIESCIVQEEHPHGCDEFVAEMMDMDATPSDIDDDWIATICQ